MVKRSYPFPPFYLKEGTTLFLIVGVTSLELVPFLSETLQNSAFYHL